MTAEKKKITTMTGTPSPPPGTRATLNHGNVRIWKLFPEQTTDAAR